MKLRQILVAGAALCLGMVSLSHAADPGPADTAHFRSVAHTLRDMADRRDLEIEILSRESSLVRDEELIQRQRTFAQRLRAVAEAAEARAKGIEQDTAR